MISAALDVSAWDGGGRRRTLLHLSRHHAVARTFHGGGHGRHLQTFKRFALVFNCTKAEAPCIRVAVVARRHSDAQRQIKTSIWRTWNGLRCQMCHPHAKTQGLMVCPQKNITGSLVCDATNQPVQNVFQQKRDMQIEQEPRLLLLLVCRIRHLTVWFVLRMHLVEKCGSERSGGLLSMKSMSLCN